MKKPPGHHIFSFFPQTGSGPAARQPGVMLQIRGVSHTLHPDAEFFSQATERPLARQLYIIVQKPVFFYAATELTHGRRGSSNSRNQR
jgi:hypothetical protein